MMLFSEWIGQDDGASAANRAFLDGTAAGAQLFLFALFAKNLCPALSCLPRIAGRLLQSTPPTSPIQPWAPSVSHSGLSVAFLPFVGLWYPPLIVSSRSRLLPATFGLLFTEALKLALRIPCPLKKPVFPLLPSTCCSDQPVPELLNR